jgi:hypothetical protein
MYWFVFVVFVFPTSQSCSSRLGGVNGGKAYV